VPSGELLRRARGGDGSAFDRLFARHLTRLLRWAHGRLPQWARDLADTMDIVQDSLVRVLGNLDRFEPVRADALQGYLRCAVDNRIKDECRRARRHLPPRTLEEADIRSPAENSPFEAAVASETEAAYVAAMARLRPEEREALVARVDLGYSYGQIALLLGKRSPDAARMTVNRALLRVGHDMRRAN
jgi:RNA polymerase sigma factor (sigma-70 family)